MNIKFYVISWNEIFIYLLLFTVSPLFAQVEKSNLSYVDPAIGGVGVILEPTRPTVHLPNSMLRVYPMKKDQIDDQIKFFPLNVLSHRVSWAFSFLPVSGNDIEKLWEKPLIIERESLTPYYYKVTSEYDGASLEFSPAERSGYFKVSFNTTERNYFRVGLFGKTGEINVAGKRVISGSESVSGMKAYFYGETDVDILAERYQNSAEKKHLLLEFAANIKNVGFKYGISYVSIEQAKRNLEHEIPSWEFNSVKERAFKIWDKKFDQIHIKGGTLAQKHVFYTALYRSYERMVDISEYGQYYSAYDHKVHTSDQPFFVDNWIWDTYIALHPLNMILDPEKDQAMIRSYIDMYRQTGWMPSFAVTFGDWPAMVGNHASVWMADAWNKGLRSFDVKTAYEGLRKNSLEATLLPWRNGPPSELDVFYNEKGYFPALPPNQTETVSLVSLPWEKRQAVSVTLENSYSDWCIGQLAGVIGRTKDKELFLRRSKFYRNVFREDRGMVWPKDAAGNWIEPYDPKLSGREYFTEVNAYTYNWHVKHDLEGLFGLMGGKKKAEAKLDQLFREDLSLPKWKFWATQPDASGLVGQFVMGNEPGLHIPYLYNYLGSPWKTQKRIRMLMDTWFTDSLFGMPGDEDGGAISAFVVFSMMGFFQVVPGVPVYTIGSPSFEEVSIRLPNGKMFRIIAKGNSKENVYIQKAKWNNKVMDTLSFTHNQLVDGGILELEMGDKPLLQTNQN